MFNVICRQFSFSCLHHDHNIHCWTLQWPSSQVQMFFIKFWWFFCYECFYNLLTVINDYCFIYKLCSLWVNLRFPFETKYNDSCGRFALITVLNLELSVWTVWEELFFIVDSYVKVNFIFLNLMKFQLVHFPLFSGYILNCGGIHLTYFMWCT